MTFKWSKVVGMNGRQEDIFDGDQVDCSDAHQTDLEDDSQFDDGYLTPMSAYTDWWMRNQKKHVPRNQTYLTRQKISALLPDVDVTASQTSFEGRRLGQSRSGKQRRLYSAHPFEYGPVLGVTRPPAEAVGGRSGRTLDEKSVIMGIIDDGIALANSRFLRKESQGQKLVSRAEFFWNQDAALVDQGNSGYLVPFGRDWNANELEAVFDHKRDRYGFPDQETVNSALEMDKILSTCAQHGTHVMDLATGYDHRDEQENELGEKPCELSQKRPIVAVQLARVATRESSGAFMSTYVTEAIDYILVRARQLQPEQGKKIPLIINFSFGIYAGTLSGNDHMEEWIDIAIKKVRKEHGFPVFVTLPSGNSYLAQSFGERRVKRSHNITMPTEPDFVVRAQPDNKAPTVVEFIWPETIENEPEKLGIGRNLLPPGLKELTLKQRFCLLKSQSKIESDLGLFLWPPGADTPVMSEIADPPNFHQGVKLTDTDDRLIGMLYHERLIGISSTRKSPDGSDDEKEADTAEHAKNHKWHKGSKPKTLLSETRKLTLILAPAYFEQSLLSKEFRPEQGPFGFTQKEATAPAGFWGVTLFRKGDEKWVDTVAVRCQRGDTPFGFRPFGRQSRLEDLNYHNYTPEGRITERDTEDQWVYRRGTLSAIATGRNTIRVGSYRLSNLDRRKVPSNRIESGASVFSSAGYGKGDEPDDWQTWGPRRIIDLAAATEISHALPGVLAAGTHSGSSFRFAGTSSAAPQIARWLAVSMEKILKDLERRKNKRLRRAVKKQAEAELKAGENFEKSYSNARTGVALLKGPGAR